MHAIYAIWETLVLSKESAYVSIPQCLKVGINNLLYTPVPQLRDVTVHMY
jgi:hypothetical protein